MNTRFLLIAIVLASFINIGQVNSACFDLTKGYFECYFLNMTLVRDGFIQYCVPDDSIPNNTLDDSVYEFYLKGSLSASIDNMRLIYEAVYDCDNYYCYCIIHRKLTLTQDAPYEIYFRSDAIYSDVKKILLDLDNALADERKSIAELQSTEGFGSDEDNLPALTNFCAKAEFTKFRTDEYIDYSACQIEFDETDSLTCEYFKLVDSEKRVAVNSQSYESRRRNLVCEIIKYRDCMHEKKMFNALTTWGESIDRLDLLDQSLDSFLNGLVSDANKINLDKRYQLMFVALMNKTFYYSSFNDGMGLANWKNQTSISLLTSKNLTVLGIIQATKYGVAGINKISITVSDEIRSERQFDISLDDKTPKNATFSNDNGVTILQVLFFKSRLITDITIINFNSESMISFQSNYDPMFTYVSVMAPKKIFEQSNGFLVSSSSQNIEKLNDGDYKMECKTKCINFERAIKATASGVYFASPNDSKKCEEFC